VNPYKNFIHKNVERSVEKANVEPVVEQTNVEQAIEPTVNVETISEQQTSTVEQNAVEAMRSANPAHRPPGTQPTTRSPQSRPPVHPRPPSSRGHRPHPEPHPHPSPRPIPHPGPIPHPMPHVNPNHTNFNDCPTSPPPTHIPVRPPQGKLTAIDRGAIAGCMHSNTYIWLRNGKSFWFYPTFVGRHSVSGYRFSRHGWVYLGFDLDRIESFFCGR